MSGTYNSGSNTATPARQLPSSPGTIVANSGDGTISSITQGTVTSTSNYAAGVVTASVTGTSTGLATIVFTADLLSTSTGSGGGTQSNTQTVTTSTTGTTLAMGNIGTTLTILNDSASPFQPYDGFTIYNSQLGQNSSDIPLDLTGISVTVQQFPTMANPAKWGQSIQNMFNYCGANPGIIGVIPPGFYDCSDLTTPLYIVSNMTIRAYGAVMFTSLSSTGDGGFVTVSSITGAIDTTAGIHNVTIMGGTWGGAGLNGALCTDNSQAFPSTGTRRTGHVFSLFANRDVSLIDVTVRGWSQGAAFYLFSNNSTTPNNSLTLRNCSFWNSDGVAGSDGIRVANGNGVLITNSNGICGGNALLFSPPGDHALQQGIGISNAYFIGGNVQSITGYAIAAMTQADSTDTGFQSTAAISHVGFIGIVGTVGPTSIAAAYIHNGNSTGAIQDVTISGGKLTGDLHPSYAGSATIGLLTVQSATIGTTTTLAGGVFDVFVSDVSLVNPTNNTVYVSGPATGTSTPPVSVKNVNFRNCIFAPPSTLVGTLTATAYVEGCIGYSFRNCTFPGVPSASILSKPLYLGASPASTLTTSASYGVIDGCSFFTSSATATGQPPFISVMRGDMNAIQGWSKFFFGPDPTILTTMPPPMAAEGILIARIAKNTFIDCVDFRGLLNTPPVSNLATTTTNFTRLGLNILTTAPSTSYPLLETGGLTLSKSQISAADMSAQTWPPQAIVLELLSSTGGNISITLTLPVPSSDGEFRVLSAPKNAIGITFPMGSPSVYGMPSTVAAGTSVRLIYDIGGYWFVA